MAQFQGEGSTKGRAVVITQFPNSETKDGRGVYLDVELDVRDPRTGSQTNPHLTTQVKSTKDAEGNAVLKTNAKGKQVTQEYNHAYVYSLKQLEAIKSVADHMQIQNPETGKVRDVYTVTADLMTPFHGNVEYDADGKRAETAKVSEREYNGIPTRTTDFKGRRKTERALPDGNVESIETAGVIINTKSLSAPQYQVTPDIVDRQFQATHQAQQAKAAERAQREAAAKEAENAAPAAPEVVQAEASAPEAAPAEKAAPSAFEKALSDFEQSKAAPEKDNSSPEFA